MTPFEKGYRDELAGIEDPPLDGDDREREQYVQGMCAAMGDSEKQRLAVEEAKRRLPDYYYEKDPADEVSLWKFILYLSLIGASVLLSLTFICWLISKAWRYAHP